MKTTPSQRLSARFIRVSVPGRLSVHPLLLVFLTVLCAATTLPLSAGQGSCPTLFRDRDGDGFGSPDVTETRVSCTTQGGYVSNDRDCNDLNPRIYPGASDDFWSETLGSQDCSLQQPYSGNLLTVNCPVCSPETPGCRASLSLCTNPQGCAFTNIQEAIWASHDGDTVEVCQGVYPERIDLQGRAIEVRGRLTHLVVLSGDGSAMPTVTLDSGEGPDTKLSHLTLSPNIHGGIGGGVYIENSSPTLTDLTLQGNTQSEEGGAMVILATKGGVASPVMSQLRFLYNHPLDGEYGAGGAVGIRASDTGSLAAPTFTDVLFADNTAMFGGAVHVLATPGGRVTPHFVRSRFLRNAAMELGSAIALELLGGTGSLDVTSSIVEKNTLASEAFYFYVQTGKLPVTLMNVTLSGNQVSRALVYGLAGPNRGQLELSVTNSIFAFNHAVDSVVKLSAYGRDSYAKGVYNYNDIWSNGYIGAPWPAGQNSQNLYSFDPRFRGFVDDTTTPDDLSLSPGSPAINAGDPAPSFDDTTNNRNDLGAYGGPSGHWPATVPTLLDLSMPLPSPEEMVLARQASFELMGPSSLTVSCLEDGWSLGTSESLLYGTTNQRTGGIDILGLKAETSYQCFAMSSSSNGIEGNAFELVTPPLPFDLQGVWNLSVVSPEARPGYTLFNFYPNGFNPMYAVMVDMQGQARWYLSMYDSSVMGFDTEAFTADTVAQYRADKGYVLVGGGGTLGALPQTHPVEPSKPAFLYPLGCASQVDEIQAICKTVPGSTVLEETPNHETIMSVDGTKVMYICSETLPQPGTTPEQYCVDSTQRQVGFSVEEWDVSNPNAPTNTWRWSSREQIEDCVLPLMAGQDDPYHANALWREEATATAGPQIFVSLRHRNQILKIDRNTSRLVYKLGALHEEDQCPALTQPDPSQCPIYHPDDATCPGQTFEPFTLQPDTTDTTCPSVASYTGPDEYHPQWFYGQHAPYLSRNSDGTASFYIHDNGRNSPDNEESPYSRGYSRAVRLKVDEGHHIATVDWQYCRGTVKGSEEVWYAPAWGSFYPIQKSDGALTDHTLLTTSHCNICVKYEDSTSENTFLAELNEQKQVLWSLDLGQNYAMYRGQRIDGCTRLPGSNNFLMGTPDLCPQASSGLHGGFHIQLHRNGPGLSPGVKGSQTPATAPARTLRHSPQNRTEVGMHQPHQKRG